MSVSRYDAGNRPCVSVQAHLSPALSAMQVHIEHKLLASLPMIQEVSHHLLDARGKQIRPICVLLSASIHGYTMGDQHIALAGIVELLHAATLLHDDVIDQADQRRGKQPAHAIWGNRSAILVGDYLYAMAFEWIAELEKADVIQALARSTRIIVEGEVRQLLATKSSNFSLQGVLATNQAKTAELFGIAFKLGAMIADVSEDIGQAAYALGLDFGMLYQLVDDVLDYYANPEDIGKPIFQDICEGKVTQPLIVLHQHASLSHQQALMAWVKGDKPLDVEGFEAIVRAYPQARKALMLAVGEQKDRLYERCQSLPSHASKPYLYALIDDVDLSLRDSVDQSSEVHSVG